MVNKNLIINYKNPSDSYSLIGEKMKDLPNAYEVEGVKIEVEREFIDTGFVLEELLIDYFNIKK